VTILTELQFLALLQYYLENLIGTDVTGQKKYTNLGEGVLQDVLKRTSLAPTT
jgi:hypothetical protein